LIAALIRHGDYEQRPDTPSAHQPFPLTVHGEQQAHAAADRLRDEIGRQGWELVPCIDSSRMLRAWQTARIIGDQLVDLTKAGMHVAGFDALAERGLGSAANLTVAQIEDVIQRDPRFPDVPPGWKTDSHYRLPLQGAESLREAGERVAAHLQRRVATVPAETDVDWLKLFVGHGAAMRHAAWHLGVLEFEQIAQLSMYHARPVFLEYLPNGRWRHVGGDWKVRVQEDRELD
jgi:2,3-bisphosphoglycerate-dependent phosphoglycerate mutase